MSVLISTGQICQMSSLQWELCQEEAGEGRAAVMACQPSHRNAEPMPQMAALSKYTLKRKRCTQFAEAMLLGLMHCLHHHQNTTRHGSFRYSEGRGGEMQCLFPIQNPKLPLGNEWCTVTLEIRPPSWISIILPNKWIKDEAPCFSC